MNRVRRSLRHHEGSEAEMGDWVDALLDDLERLRLIDDRTWATSRLGALKRRGLSERAIRAKLREKRVEAELIDELLEDKPVDALLGAVHFARKRRIGPFREKDRDANRDRDLGKLARGGYPFSIAREILDMDEEEAFERSFQRPE